VAISGMQALLLNHSASTETEQATPLASQILHGLYQPFALAISEPIVILCAIYMAIINAILFTCLTGYTSIYGDTYDFNQAQVGLCFLAMLIGNFCVVPLIPVVYKLYIKGHQYSILGSDEPLTDRNGSALAAPSAESHMHLALCGAPCIPISMFWMAYSISGKRCHHLHSRVVS
jgi:hypothetical protein